MPKFIPDTMVEVKCGCRLMVNVRVRKKDNGTRILSCHNCLRVIEVNVYSGGQVSVYISNQDGSGRKQAVYEKVYQE